MALLYELVGVLIIFLDSVSFPFGMSDAELSTIKGNIVFDSQDDRSKSRELGKAVYPQLPRGQGEAGAELNN